MQNEDNKKQAVVINMTPAPLPPGTSLQAAAANLYQDPHLKAAQAKMDEQVEKAKRQMFAPFRGISNAIRKLAGGNIQPSSE